MSRRFCAMIHGMVRTCNATLVPASVLLAVSPGCGRIGLDLTSPGTEQGPVAVDDGDGNDAAATAEVGAPDSGAGAADGSLRDAQLDCPSPCRNADGSADEPNLTACPCAATEGTPVCDAGLCDGACEFSGTYALRVDLPTTWSSFSNPNLRSGSGTHHYWLKLDATHHGRSLRGTMVECGRFSPAFEVSLVPETYHFQVPASLFDSGLLPSTAVDITLSDASPEAAVTLGRTAFLIGLTLSDPTTADWPSSASGLAQVDVDQDGKPGATFRYLDDDGAIHPRTSTAVYGFNRAELPYGATRLVFELGGAFNSCTEAAGPATVHFIDTHIFGCKRSGSSRDCSDAEAFFLDQNALNYQLGDAAYVMAKLVDGASCAQVRAALP